MARIRRLPLLPPTPSPSLSPPARLVCGIISPDPETLDRAVQALGREFGPPAERSALIPFDFTDYYQPEFGPDLTRCWVDFEGGFDPAGLAATKLRTNELERTLAASDGRRTANLDPGALTLNNLVLASTKDHAHRVYLGAGIFAELTLVFESGAFRTLPWTYPDYRTPACLEFLARSRARLLAAPRAG